MCYFTPSPRVCAVLSILSSVPLCACVHVCECACVCACVCVCVCMCVCCTWLFLPPQWQNEDLIRILLSLNIKQGKVFLAKYNT